VVGDFVGATYKNREVGVWHRVGLTL